MLKPFFFTLFFCSTFLFSQTKITVLEDYPEDTPIASVIVLDDKNVQLGQTNAQGIFVVPANIQHIQLVLPGYETKKLFVYGKDIITQLTPITVHLATSEISNTDDRARNLIKEVIQNKKKNSIENLKTYEYKTYTKFLVTASTDSMPYILFPRNENDSSYNEVRRLLDKSHLMLGERAMDHKFSHRFGHKNTVKATRISGTKLPMYEFMAMQPISHSLEEDKIKFFLAEFANPISNLGLKEYRYRLSEPEKIEGKTLTVIAFYPSNNKTDKQQIKGYIWVDPTTKAVARFYAENLSETKVAELEMEWTAFQNFWVPSQQRFRMDGGSISYPSLKDSVLSDGQVRLDTIKKRERVWLHLTTHFKDLISPKEFERKEFKGYETDIDLDAVDESDEVLKAYRDNQLTEMEENTYVKIDSIGQKYNMDRNIRLMRVLTSGGKYGIGKFDLDLTQLFNYNNYEGFRLGLGGNTNYKFNDRLSLNGYVAYGFKDEAFKYGGGFDYLVNKPYSGKIFANYANDVAAAGRNRLDLQNAYVQFLQQNLSNLYNDHFYSYQRVKLGYQQDFLQNITLRVAGIYHEKTAEFDYQYQSQAADHSFKSLDTEIALRWAPKDRYVRTPYGKVTINSGLPVFYLTFSQGWKAFDASHTPTKIDFTYLDEFRTFLGKTDFQFHAGKVWGDTPILNLYEGMGNAKKGNQILKHFGVAGLNNFETMRPGEFYSDQYVMFNFSHKFAGFRLFNREIFPDFIYRGLLGDMKNPEDHQIIEFQSPNQLYQEAGLEFNQLIYKMIGVGAYYRFGAYHLPTFDHNFFVKLTLKMDLF